MLFLATSSRAADGDPFEQWPESWANAYRRFESFNAARERSMPRAHLEFSASGHIAPQTDLAPDWEKHLKLDFYHDGVHFFGTSGSPDILSDDRGRFFPASKYAVRLQTLQPNDSQSLYPIAWFETFRGKAPPDEIDYHGDLRVRMVPAPEPAEDFWPCERLLKFQDFTHFPPGRPLPDSPISGKLSPSVALKLENSGTIVREKLDAPLEKLLQWRIYHDGRLVEKGPAVGVVRYAVPFGPGVYQAFLGVQGPTGFMPVSDPLHFPLFPAKDGGCEVFPTVTNLIGFPDFLVDIIPPEVMAEILAASMGGKEPKNAYYSRRTVYRVREIAPLADEKQEKLRRLWVAWAWTINAYRATPALPARGLPNGF